MEFVLLALIVIPLAVCPLFMLIPSQYPQLSRYLAALAGGTLFALSVLLFAAYGFDGGSGLRYELQWVWLENIGFLGENGITFYLGLDGIGAPLVLLNGVVIFAAVFVSWNIADRTKDFFVLLFLLVAGVYGVFISQDLFFFFFWYEVAVLPMFLLIAVWGSSSEFKACARTKEYGEMKRTWMLVGGSVVVGVAIVAVFVEACSGTSAWAFV